MFLQNVPLAATLQPKWRSFEPPPTFSLPLCFTDSEPELSTRNTSIPENVQMIIDSLRSTQSSLDVSDEYEESMHHNKARSHHCVEVAGGKEAAAQKRSAEGVHVEPPFKSEATRVGSLTPDSDSDDSVDRDIEEAIQEYLKEKNDYGGPSTLKHKVVSRNRLEMKKPKKLENSAFSVDLGKFKVEPNELKIVKLNTGKRSWCSSSSTSSDDSFDQSIHEEIKRFLTEKKGKVEEECVPKTKLKKRPSPSKRARQRPNFVAAKLHLPRTAEKKTDDPRLPAAINYVKQMTPIQPTPAVPRPAAKSDKPGYVGPLCVKKSILNRSVPSGNGIKKTFTGAFQDQQRETQNASDDDDSSTDSSSDDGIEEAILLYQQEKNKEKGEESSYVSGPTYVKPSQPEDPRPSCQESFQPLKSIPDATTALCPDPDPSPLNLSYSDSHKQDTTVNSVSLASGSLWSMQNIPFKANTSAELMCAEAILDISKAVLPVPVDPSVTVSHFCSNPIAPTSEVMPTNSVHGDSTSGDSEDGIEQEIRNFLALKAQQNSLAAVASSFGPAIEYGMENLPIKKKMVGENRPKPMRLSLTSKRKLKEARSPNCKVRQPKTALNPEPHLVPTSLPACVVNTPFNFKEDHDGFDKEDVAKSKTFEQGPKEGARTAQGGLKQAMAFRGPKSKLPIWKSDDVCQSDKSSSLDSDEDLDAAIKELLKTKKKVKRKSKVSKQKAKKRVRFSEVQLLPVKSQVSSHQLSPLSPPPRGNQKNPKSSILKDQAAAKQPPKAKPKRSPLEQKKTEKTVNASPPSTQSQRFALSSADSGRNQGPALVPEQTDDESSVDSDDSIEQEIQKFLAEKAKSSVRETKDSEKQNDKPDSEADNGKDVKAKESQTCRLTGQGQKISESNQICATDLPTSDSVCDKGPLVSTVINKMPESERGLQQYTPSCKKSFHPDSLEKTPQISRTHGDGPHSASYCSLERAGSANPSDFQLSQPSLSNQTIHINVLPSTEMEQENSLCERGEMSSNDVQSTDWVATAGNGSPQDATHPGINVGDVFRVSPCATNDGQSNPAASVSQGSCHQASQGQADDGRENVCDVELRKLGSEERDSERSPAGKAGEEDLDESFLDSDVDQRERLKEKDEPARMPFTSTIDTGITCSTYFILSPGKRPTKYSSLKRQIWSSISKSQMPSLQSLCSDWTQKVLNVANNKFSINVRTFYKNKKNEKEQMPKETKPMKKKKNKLAFFPKVLSVTRGPPNAVYRSRPPLWTPLPSSDLTTRDGKRSNITFGFRPPVPITSTSICLQYSNRLVSVKKGLIFNV
ncbi:protein phosphatase 1 regulatory subunit 26 isoform X2 [Polypterus senegalus]|uniref:protein phosphatase 1 regulatory subunit 26 isoform X2 n=1 Tax=Polypterus senegalus TaxID=55291 RepID=UPI00196426FE|nr:protein phosphatase 1 regulatory subunit 26 isoform X2 [Polypterus senegalus]